MALENTWRRKWPWKKVRLCKKWSLDGHHLTWNPKFVFNYQLSRKHCWEKKFVSKVIIFWRNFKPRIMWRFARYYFLSHLHVSIEGTYYTCLEKKRHTSKHWNLNYLECQCSQQIPWIRRLELKLCPQSRILCHNDSRTRRNISQSIEVESNKKSVNLLENLAFIYCAASNQFKRNKLIMRYLTLEIHR